MDPTSCNWCFKTPTTKLCDRCKFVAYCSKACQSKDADVHKVICQGSKELLKRSPKPILHLALLLPDDQLSPKHVWLKFNMHEVAGALQEQPDLTETILRGHLDDVAKLKSVLLSSGDNQDRIEIIGVKTDFGDGLKEK